MAWLSHWVQSLAERQVVPGNDTSPLPTTTTTSTASPTSQPTSYSTSSTLSSTTGPPSSSATTSSTSSETPSSSSSTAPSPTPSSSTTTSSTTTSSTTTSSNPPPTGSTLSPPPPNTTTTTNNPPPQTQTTTTREPATLPPSTSLTSDGSPSPTVSTSSGGSNHPSPSLSRDSSLSGTAIPTARSGSKTNTAAIAGGAAGGVVAAILLLVLAIFCIRAALRRRRSSWQPDLFDPHSSVYYKEGVTMDLGNEVDDDRFEHSPAATTHRGSNSYDAGATMAAAGGAHSPYPTVAHARSGSWDAHPYDPYATNAFYGRKYQEQPQLPEKPYGYAPSAAGPHYDPCSPYPQPSNSSAEGSWEGAPQAPAAGTSSFGPHTLAPLAFPVAAVPASKGLTPVDSNSPLTATAGNGIRRSSSTLASVYEEAPVVPHIHGPSPSSSPSPPSGSIGSYNSGTRLRNTSGGLDDVPLSPAAAAGAPREYSYNYHHEPEARNRRSTSLETSTDRTSFDTARTGAMSFDTARGDSVAGTRTSGVWTHVHSSTPT